MNDELKPPPSELADLIDAERARPHVTPASVSIRLWQRLEASAGASATGGLASAKSGFAGKLLTGVLLYVAGAASGAGLYAAFRPAPEPRSMEVRENPTPPAPSAQQVDAPPPPAVAAPADAPVRKQRTPSADPSSTLLEESRLLESARASIVNADPRGAMATLSAHRTRFPNGELSEERDALEVQALAVSGKTEQAQSAADAFRTRYPDSMLLPVVEETIRGAR